MSNPFAMPTMVNRSYPLPVTNSNAYANATASANSSVYAPSNASVVAPSFIDKSRTNVLTDNSQAHPVNNFQLKSIIKAPQTTQIYYDGKKFINNNYHTNYYYMAAAQPQPEYLPPIDYPPIGNCLPPLSPYATTTGYGYPTGSNYNPFGYNNSEYARHDGQSYLTDALGLSTGGSGYPYSTGNYPPVGCFPQPQQPQDNTMINLILSFIFPLLQQQKQVAQDPNITTNVTVKNELKDLVNMIIQNKNEATANATATADVENNKYKYDDNREYTTVTNRYDDDYYYDKNKRYASNYDDDYDYVYYDKKCEDTDKYTYTDTYNDHKPCKKSHTSTKLW
jgi:hypothetical protein